MLRLTCLLTVTFGCRQSSVLQSLTRPLYSTSCMPPCSGAYLSLQQLATQAERVPCVSQQQLPQPAQMFYRKVGEQAYEHLDPSLQYNITLKDCGYDLPGPHDIWVAVDMSVLYGLGNPGGEPPLPPAHPDKKTDSCQVNSGV